MIIMEFLYLIGSRNPNPTHAANEWLRKSIGDIFCPECRQIKRKIYPGLIDIILEEYDRNDIAGAVDKVGICIYHRDFIAQIFDYMKDFGFGKCYTEAGDLIPELVTVYSKEYIILRGNKNSDYRICDTCGTVNTYATSGKKYILRYQIKDWKQVYGEGGYLYIADELVPNLDLSQWKYAKLDKVLIRDKPIDGRHFPGDPE